MEQDKRPSSIRIKADLIGAFVGVVATCVLWLTCSFLLFSQAIPPSMISVCSYASLAVGAIVGTFFAAMSGGKRLLNSEICAVVMLAFYLILGLFLKNAVFSPISLLIVLIILAISAIIGSVISTLFR